MSGDNLKYIIGIVGPLACGKGLVADYLVTHYGFVTFSLSFIVHQEVKNRGLSPTTRGLLQDTGDDLRQKYGGDILAKRSINFLEQEGSHRVVLEGIRNPGEVIYLKTLPNFVLMAVEADRSLRYQRLIERNKPWDPKDWQGFLKIDERDLGKGQVADGQQVGKCIEIADYSISNNKDVKSLYDEVEKVIDEIVVDRPHFKEIFHKTE
ncbi:hypothetical protein COS81_00155 [candidate division WWE3 bacterium CG06_land_8_20_14_3_00_42_16]|uniref:Adenylate kinase n=4 Tax=Katanobacteria TaxID=422282 RepID=A0A2M7APR4_UNCKA|nr:MAG: hypothetical protein AUJ38_00610 [bacterium CG1_02_42_9]PIU69367.1 MAG: hypothetical protein COS81_00155 [candidate division WWE3 bacterium CG06_land_8_20_14_3_00_42_16]PIZ43470.1 MAG: hypothetical protein COY34_00775 [candidate division WWE3 bacterium CG_4_10_14_0_2_um_filter_42_8]PJA37382.1 MAG: hypothetical protein CO181_03780 [candidate division WWE3 bacterium CG_4_9_14_3_um_filter_43_9]PJC69220.1 MAG: hypothetical protein CO015_01175 [candidate division WWE3 bacterium CG_4_8_14_3_u